MTPELPAGGASIPERFRAVVRTFPRRLAVRTATASWTYEELDEKAARLAAGLLEAGLRAGDPVLLHLHAEAPLFAAMLGVLRAGGLYVPLDPGLPAARADGIARLSAARLLVTDRASHEAVRRLAVGPRVLGLDRLLSAGPLTTDLPVEPDAVAYVLFTSGSTGEPKGVMQSHRTVLRNVARLSTGLRLTAEDRLSLLTSPGQGASASDIFGALLNGAALLPFDVRTTSPAAWKDWAHRERLTVWHSIPGLFRSLARAMPLPETLPELRLLKLGGETVFATDLELFKRRFREGVVFHVGLGMTEMNVVRQWFADHGTVCPHTVAPVGYAVDGVDVQLGEDDEIEIVSTDLSPGYWRRPDLSAAAFREEGGTPARRRFRTGDVGRILPDGCLVHLGRRDTQAKVRGHRVDLAEVEGAIRALPGVREAAVAVRETRRAGRELVTWIVSEGTMTPGTLRRGLSPVLPEHAIPTALVALDELPRSAGGKVDRGTLPEPARFRIETGAPILAPRNEAEALVVRVFQDVLAIEGLSASDDFFDLGGSSLLLVDALLRLEEAFDLPVDAAHFLEEPTPAGLARLLGDATRPSVVAPLAEGEGKPVFWIPGHGAGEGPDLLALSRLARLSALRGPSFALRLPADPPADASRLLETWEAVVREQAPDGISGIVASCAGGPLGFELARRLGRFGPVRLVLHDALFPTGPRRLRRILKRFREPWGDDLVVRAREHAAQLRRRSLREAGRYALRRVRSVAAGFRRLADPALRRRLARRATWLRLAFSRRPEPWDGDVLLVVTPSRAGAGLDKLWRPVAPRLAVTTTGVEATAESAVAIHRFLSI